MTTSSLHPGIKVDRRPLCRAIYIPANGESVWCDRPVGHDGDHEAYYGWTGRSEVWS